LACTQGAHSLGRRFSAGTPPEVPTLVGVPSLYLRCVMSFWNRSDQPASRSVPKERLRELWRTTDPGDSDNEIFCVLASDSVFISEGWNVPYAALRLHRLEISSGRQVADVRTRSQGVAGMVEWQDHLLAATDSRLFQFRTADLSIARQWDTGLVAFARQLVPAGRLIAMANWLRPSIGILDPESAKTSRLKVGAQPLLFGFAGEVRVINGFDGGMLTLDAERRQLLAAEATPPVSAVTAGRDIWAVIAGPPQGGQGQPPVWIKRGTDTVKKLSGSALEARVGGRCDRLTVDDQRGVVWCLLERGTHLQAVSTETGEVMGTFEPGLAGREQLFRHVDPAAGLAFATEPHRVVEGSVIRSSTSTLVCFALPDLRSR
jgi:hypothetical protein